MGEMLGMDKLPLWANGLVVLATIVVVGFGAHWVVESATRIAKQLGISELIIGLTVVALGTSAPEFAVTLIAAFKGHGDISVGNIVGSNIFNLGFILGGCALVRAIPTNPTLLRRDGTVIGGTTLLILALIGWDLRLDRHDGVLLFLLLGIYLAFLFKQRHAVVQPGQLGEHGEAARSESHNVGQTQVQQAGAQELGEAAHRHPSVRRDAMLLLVGLLCIVVGSHFLVESASVIARGFGVSEWIIGVTIVAAGTSAPEFATSLAGVIKGSYAISAGNVIGSDIFNLLGVLGVAGMLRPMEIDAAARISLAALCGMVFLVLFFMRTGWRVSRLEGFLLVAVAVSRWCLDFSARVPGP